MTIVHTTEVSTPIGRLCLAATADKLYVLTFPRLWSAHRARLERHLPGVRFTEVTTLPPFTDALDDYFAGDLAALDRLAVEPLGTPFQRRVWLALRSIPAGATASYAEQARRVGAPSAVRAVGAANGANPIGVVLPCHRVIGSSGALTGYAGGLEAKRWLLAHEQRAAGLTLPFAERSPALPRSAPSPRPSASAPHPRL